MDLWSLLKSLRVDSFVLKKLEIEDFLTSAFYGSNTTQICIVARPETKYAG